MKNNKYKILFIMSFLFVLLLSLTGCDKKPIEAELESDFEVFKGDNTVYDTSVRYFDSKTGIGFYNTCYSEVYDDNVLCLSFLLEIQNHNRDNRIKLTAKDPVAYGNDIKLEEQVLSYYTHHDEIKGGIFTDETIVLNKMKRANLGLGVFRFYLAIKDGNPLCKYRIDFKLNNVNVSLYSYEEGYELNEFTYIHNPSYNENVLADAEYDKSAVFGYKPNETGSLKQYRDADWTDKDSVLGYKQNRIEYISLNDQKIRELENKLRSENKTIEETASQCSNLRNQIRLDQYKDDPEGLELLKERNLEKYGHEEGPLPSELYLKYGSWEIVLEKCYSINRAMDACCGVYDMYYYLYNDFAY